MDITMISQGGATGETNIADDTKIYRYLSFFSLLAILEEKTMPFRKITKFEDPWEAPTRYWINLRKERQEGMKQFLENVFVSCWSLKTQNSSDALWRIYSQDKLGVCIESTVGDLKATLEDSCCSSSILLGAIAPIIYKNQLDFMAGYEFGRNYCNEYGDYIALTCNKRPAFSHEDEIRVMVITKDKCDKDVCVLNNINSKRLINKIWLDPRLEDWTANSVKAYLNRQSITCEKSDLYTTSKFKIGQQ